MFASPPVQQPTNGFWPRQPAASLPMQQSRLILDAIKQGIARKDQIYTPGAMECARFYIGDHRYLFTSDFIKSQLYFQVGGTDTGNQEKPGRIPQFRISDNWAARYVQVFSPYLNQGEPVRSVIPKQTFMPTPVCYGIDPMPVIQMKMATLPPDQTPMYVQQQQMAMNQLQMDYVERQVEIEKRSTKAELMEYMLEQSNTEFGYKVERRKCIDESLIFGMAGFLTEIVNIPSTQSKSIVSNYVAANDIIWDPDCTDEKKAKWLAIEQRCSAWEFAKMFGVPEKDIKPTHTTITSSNKTRLWITEGGGQIGSREPLKDEVVYYKFWSRMGSGARFLPLQQRTEQLSQLDEAIGDYCFFVVTDSLDYAVQFAPDKIEAIGQLTEMVGQMMPEGDPLSYVMKAATKWPMPYYMDPDDPWPITILSYHRRNGTPYPIPPLEFALSYIKFLVWIISFVADKTARANRDFWLADDRVSGELIKAIQDADDEPVVKMKEIDGKTVDQLVKILSAPGVHADILKIYQFFEQQASQITGLNDLMQATMNRSMRTATEAQVVSDASQLRPRSMLQRLSDADIKVARKEAIANAIVLNPETDVLPIIGRIGAQAWAMLFPQSQMPGQDNPAVINEVMREMQYNVVCSQGRVLDLATRQDQTNKMSQMISPLFLQLAQFTGNFKPLNTVNREWAKANTIDPDMVTVPDMGMPNPGVGVASNPKPASDNGPSGA